MYEIGSIHYWWEWLLWGAIIYLVFAPTRYDPAIRLKEWLMRKGRKHGRDNLVDHSSRDRDSDHNSWG